MKLLLDTHVFLGIADLGSARLPDEMLNAMTHASAKLYASVASLWEIAIKTRLGKLELWLHPAALVDLCTAASATILPIQAPHVPWSISSRNPERGIRSIASSWRRPTSSRCGS